MTMDAKWRYHALIQEVRSFKTFTKYKKDTADKFKSKNPRSNCWMLRLLWQNKNNGS